MNDEKMLEVEGKQVFIHGAPATIAFDVALRYRAALENNDPEKLQSCLYTLLEYAELKLEDGRRVKLGNKTLIDQHFHSAATLMTLQQKAVEVNFGFLADGAA